GEHERAVAVCDVERQLGAAPCRVDPDEGGAGERRAAQREPELGHVVEEYADMKRRVVRCLRAEERRALCGLRDHLGPRPLLVLESQPEARVARAGAHEVGDRHLVILPRDGRYVPIEVHVATAAYPGLVAPPHSQSRPWKRANAVPCRGTSIATFCHLPVSSIRAVATMLVSPADSPPATTVVPPSSAAAAPDVAVGSVARGRHRPVAGSRQSIRLLVSGVRPPAAQMSRPST